MKKFLTEFHELCQEFFCFVYLFQQKIFVRCDKMFLKANSDKERVFYENKRK